MHTVQPTNAQRLISLIEMNNVLIRSQNKRLGLHTAIQDGGLLLMVYISVTEKPFRDSPGINIEIYSDDKQTYFAVGLTECFEETCGMLLTKLRNKS